MAGNELKITISAQDNASAVFSKLADGAKKVADSLEKAGKDGGEGFERVAESADRAEASFAKLSGAGDGMIRTFDGLDGELVKLGGGLQSVGTGLDALGSKYIEQQRQVQALNALYGNSSIEFQRFADQIQNTTLFSDDQARQAEAYFATLKNNYGVTEDQIKRLVQVSADLAQVHGFGLEDAALRIQAAIRGEAEAAEALGLTMNQQSIDRENLTLTMSNQEAAQFRLNALWQQTANVSGQAQQAVGTLNGIWRQSKNEMQDVVQVYGSAIGPIGDVFNTLGRGATMAGETVRGLKDIKSGVIGLVGTVASMGPLGLALTGVTAALGIAGYAFLKNKQDAAEAKAAWDAAGASIDDLSAKVLQMQLSGQGQAAGWAGRLATQTRSYFDQFNSDVDQFLKDLEKRGSYLSMDGPGKAFVEEFYKSLDPSNVDDAWILEQWDSGSSPINAAIATWAKDNLKDPALQQAVGQGISDLFDLSSNQYVDQQALRAGTDKVLEMMMSGETPDAIKAYIDGLIKTLAEGASRAKDLATDWKLAFQLDDLRIQGKDGLANDLQEINDLFEKGIGTSERFRELMVQPSGVAPTAFFGNIAESAKISAENMDLVAMAQERITNALLSGNYDNPKILALVQGLNTDLANGVITGDQWAMGMLVVASSLDQVTKSADVATPALQAVNSAGKEALATLQALASVAGQAGAALGTQYDDIATKAAAATEAAVQARNAFDTGAGSAAAMGHAVEAAMEGATAAVERSREAIADWLQLTGNDNFVSQLNLAGLGTTYTQLAEGVNDANTAMSDGYRIIVGNTNAIAQNAQQVTDWATELINVEGTYGKIDDLLANNTITLSQYRDAQAAYNSIAADNASIQEDILTIQAKQAPVLADLMAGTQDYVETISTLPPMQQAVALGWMDANEAAKANQILTMAAAAANGELGSKGKEATTAMIQGAVAADPYLKAMLLDLGLISEGADGTITVNFDGAKSTNDAIEELTKSIDALIETLGGIPPIHVDPGDLPQVAAALDATTSAADKAAAAIRGVNQAKGGYTGADVPGSGGYIDSGPVVPVTAQVTEVDTSSAPQAETPATAVVTETDASQVQPVDVPARLSFDMGEAAGGSILNAAQNALGGLNDIKVKVTATADIADAVIGLYNLKTQADTLNETAIEIPVSIKMDTTTMDVPSWLSPWLPSENPTGGAASFDPIEVTASIKAQDDASDTITSVQTAADTLGATNAVVSLSAVNGASSVILGAQSLADTFGSTSVSATLGATDNASGTIQNVIDLMGSFQSKTVTLAVNTVYSTTGVGPTARHGGIPEYATGGVLFRGGEAGPEIAHFAGGGMATLPYDGLYLAPQGTRIEPANSAITKLSPGGMGGAPHVTVIIQGNVIGIEDLEAKVGGAIARGMAEVKVDRDRALGVA